MKKKSRFLPSGARKFLLSQSFGYVSGECMGGRNPNRFPKYKKIKKEIKI